MLLLDKPSGLSSNAALQRARRAFDAEKAGHTGTLDPLASGLLPLCFGEATKFAQFLLDATKRYTATVRFGVTTTTGDAEGEVSRCARRAGALRCRGDAPGLHRPPVADSARLFRAQVRRAQSLRIRARGHRGPAPAARHRNPGLVLLDWQSPDAVLDVPCSKGTYVRVLAEDLGRELGCGAHLAALRRTATGGFGIADAIPLEQLEAMDDAGRAARCSPSPRCCATCRRCGCAAADAARFRQGGAVPAPDWETAPARCLRATICWASPTRRGASRSRGFPAPLIHALDELAGKLHISRSELVRRSCQNALSMRSEADADPTAQSGC